MKLPPTVFILSLLLCFDIQAATRDYEIAGRFAPVFYQALGDNPRSDYITNFDFDGDWRGDNNWDHAADKQFPLKAYVYYSVAETTTHLFIHYAVFHARDYKGGTTRGRILSEILREGAGAAADYDPTGMASVATVAHENDMEGCLVVVEKSRSDQSPARVVYVVTVAHNKFLKYTTSGSWKPEATAVVVDGRALLYVEPKGHGILNYLVDPKTGSRMYETGEMQSETTAEKSKESGPKAKDRKAKKKDGREANVLVIYTFAGKAGQPDKAEGHSCGYDLIPLETTLWKRAQGEPNETYGVSFDYPPVTISVVSKTGSVTERQAQIGLRGVAFLGKTGGQNIARAPWGWFDVSEESQPLGLWFFDPAKAIKKSFIVDEAFSTTYLRHPLLGIG